METRLKTRPWLLLGAGLLLVGGVWLVRQPLREHIRNAATLANSAPPPEVVAAMIEQSANPPAALLAAWQSGKIVHRETAIHELGMLFHPDQPLPVNLASVLPAAAADPDVNVRESAFGILQNRKDPALTALAAAQLNDIDSTVRLLGLRHLDSAPASVGVPLVIGLLDDPELPVAIEAVKLLQQWSGQDFGAKLRDAVAGPDPQSGLLEFPAAGAARDQIAINRARAWWHDHQAEYPPVKLPLPALAAQSLLPAIDFQLRTLSGDLIRLSDLRGRVVLINFWTTWCTACVAELPELVALQKQHPGNLKILGVSLDFVPDDDGDQKLDPATIRPKIARTIQERGLNYPVLLDEHNEVGGCFNGGELPTTIIIDAEGNVRRRFVGTRRLREFAAMIQEASLPPAAAGLARLAQNQPPAFTREP